MLNNVVVEKLSLDSPANAIKDLQVLAEEAASPKASHLHGARVCSSDFFLPFGKTKLRKARFGKA